MTQRVHFISGLPRSGSTLLGAILRQNPRFYASMTGPVGGLFRANLQAMSAGSELALLVTDEQRRALLKGLFTSFYGLMTDKQVVFDTNSQWTAHMSALRALFPEARVIATVRNVAWVMDSLERLFRNDPFENTRLFGPGGGNTVYGRVNALAQPDKLVGSAYMALKEAFYSEEADRLLLVDYDLLTRAPDRVLPLIYDFIEEPWFDHDFDNVEFDAPEFDAALGVRGLHTVRPKVERKPRRTILPPDLFEKYANMDFWRDRKASRANVITPEKSPAAADPAPAEA